MLVAMSCGAMNDNLLRGALLVAVAVGGTHAWAGELGSGGTGWVTFMLYVPFIVLLGVTGQLADRFPRRTIIIISRVLEVGLSGLAVLAFAGLLLGMVVAQSPRDTEVVVMVEDK